MNNSDLFEDSFDFEKYQSKGIAELRRRYKEKLSDGSQQYTMSKDSALVVAKGISAFLSIEQYLTHPSIRLKLRNNDILDLYNYFTHYFEHCLKFLQNEENRKLFKNEKRSVEELTYQHCKDEEQYYTDSQLLYDQVRSSEKQIIEQINKAANHYLEWVKMAYLTPDKDNKSNKLTFVVTEYTENQLNIIATRLIKEKIIDPISTSNFIYLFTGQEITEHMKSISWKESRPLAHEFLRRVVYGEDKFNMKQVNECIKFLENKKLDSNDKSTAQYKFNDILDKILYF